MADLPLRYLVLNQSRITDFMTCPRFFELRHIERMDKGAKALRIGTMTHNALEAYYRKREEGEEHEPTQPAGSFDEEWEVVEKLYYAYRRKFKGEDLTLIQPEVEVTSHFGKVTTSKAIWHIWLIARLDGIFQNSDGRWLCEHKTAANLGAAQFARFLNDYQLTTYLWMGNKELQLDLKGAVCNILPKTKTPDPARIMVARCKYQFREWEATTMFEAKNIIICTEKDHFPQRQINCTMWNRACLFHDACITGDIETLTEMESRVPDYADKLRARFVKGELDGT